MSVNKYKPHLYVIPEDDADRQLADGFVLHPRVKSRQVQVVPPAGGWSRVLDTFTQEYLPILQQNPHVHVVLLIDFDGDPAARRAHLEAAIPAGFRDRVFIIGPRDTPEALRNAVDKSFESIGQALAEDCAGEKLDTWAHEHLHHNDIDRQRLVQIVKPFLFG